MYDALKARNFDGQSDPLGVVLSLRLYEAQTYLSLTAHWWSGFTLLANETAWQALPRAMQEVVERNAEKYALLQRHDIEQVNAAGAEELAGRGMQSIPPTQTASGSSSGSFTPAGKKKRDPRRGACWNPTPVKSADSAFRLDGKRSLVL